MGKVAIILVIGFSVALGVMGRSITRRLSDAVENASTYSTETAAKNIAASAVEIYVRKMKIGAVSTGTYTNTMLGGTATVTISKIDVNSAALPDTFKLRAIGKIQKSSDTVVVFLAENLSVPTMPIYGALSVGANGKMFLHSTGSDSISGDNHDLNGAPSGACSGVHGLAYGQLGGLDPGDPLAAKVMGVGGYLPDTFRNNPQPDYLPLVQQLTPLANKTINGGTTKGLQTFGTLANPQITVITGSAKFNDGVTGAGILIIAPGTSGKVNFDGGLNFSGLVFLVGGPNSNMEVKFNGPGTINGGLVMAGDKASLNTTAATNNGNSDPGGININYSCQAIGLAYGVPALAGNYIIYDWWE